MSDKELIVQQTFLPPTLTEAREALEDLRRKLGRKTPSDLIKYRDGPIDRRTGKRAKFAYVRPGYVMSRLNAAFGPAWSFEKTEIELRQLLPIKRTGGDAVERIEVIFRGYLVTPFGKQYAVAGHVYYPSNAEQGLGDAEQSAASKALKRAASRLGVALDLYAEPDESVDTTPADDQSAAWRAACAKYGLTEGNAIAMISENLTGDLGGLASLADICDALGGDVFDAVKALETARKALEEPIVGVFREVPVS